MICPLHAWGDESIRSHGLDAPAYLLGASIVDTDDADDVRETLLLLRRHGRKLHWRDLSDGERDTVSRTVSTLPALHIVVLAEGIDLRKQERARARCLERLSWTLECEFGVTELTLEQRPATLMRRDRRMVDILKMRSTLSTDFRVEHGAPGDEPMLWLPDQVVGAVAEGIAGTPRWMAHLATITQTVCLPQTAQKPGPVIPRGSRL